MCSTFMTSSFLEVERSRNVIGAQINDIILDSRHNLLCNSWQLLFCCSYFCLHFSSQFILNSFCVLLIDVQQFSFFLVSAFRRARLLQFFLSDRCECDDFLNS